MFGLGTVAGLKRKEYNTRVKDILERFGIETEHTLNPRFPAILAFADLIAQGWYSNSSAEDTSLDIALRYIVGGLKAGGDALEEARTLSEPVLAFLMESATAGKVTDSRARAMVAYYDEHSWRLLQRSGTTAEPDAKSKSATVKCPSCGQLARVPYGRNLRIKCPRCEQSWVQRTSDTSPKPDSGASDPGRTKQSAWNIVRP